MNIPDKIVEGYAETVQQADVGAMTQDDVLCTYDEFATFMNRRDCRTFTFPAGVNGNFMQAIQYLYKNVGLRVKHGGSLISRELSESQAKLLNSLRDEWSIKLFLHALNMQYEE